MNNVSGWLVFLKPIIAIFIVNIVLSIVLKNEKSCPSFLLRLGTESLEIYLLHRFVLVIGRYLVQLLKVNNMFIGIFFVTILGIIVPIIIFRTLERYSLGRILFSPSQYLKS